MVLDKNLTLPKSLKIFNDDHPTVLVTEQGRTQQKGYRNPQLSFFETPFHERLPMRILKHLQERKIGVLMIEGGVTILNTFIEQGYWDEARVIVGKEYWTDGIDAPRLPVDYSKRLKLGQDEILQFYKS
jgi:diaminohydroxyphosphoribosylaminopyrimidine deaminase/5-amino-6-(5-phosphoribosylamino)uracil reductase